MQPAISELPKLRSMAVSEPWIDELAELSLAPYQQDAVTPFISPVALKPHYRALRVRGKIPPHTDRAFPQWNYMLVFRADSATLMCHGHEAIRLKRNMLVEFDEHRRHRVAQPPDSVLVWMVYDVDSRLSLQEALDGHRRKFFEGGSADLQSAKPREFRTDKYRIVADGRIMWVYTTNDFCTAFMDRGGFSVCVRGVDRPGATYPLLTMRRPRKSDWDKMSELMRRHYGFALPAAAMPRFLTGAADAHA